MKDNTAVIKISKKSHKILKEYCKRNSLKLYQWAENVLVEKVEEKKSDNLQDNKSN